MLAKVHENIFGNTIPLNRGFGQQKVLSYQLHNEWKRKKVTQEQCLIQQATKNIKMNKVILKLPLFENEYEDVYDWYGLRG